MVPGSGIQVQGWGRYGHILKMYCYNIFSAQNAFVIVGDKVMHCYVHFVLMLNYEIHCLCHRTEVEAFKFFWVGEGGVVLRLLNE